MKYTNKHLNCSGSIKYTEIYGYYEIQCPFNVSTCINKPDQSISVYVNNGTQCGLFRSYDDCKLNCSQQCLYHDGDQRIEMKQDIFIPSIARQSQNRYAPKWYYYCPAYIDWRNVGLKCSFLVLVVYALIVGLIILIQLIKICKKSIPAYYIYPYEQKIEKQYISNDIYGVKERKRIEEQQEKQKRKNKKQE